MKIFKGQTKRLSKNENAITLVALIITIIILIILAAVTINSLTHDGLADMAIKGAQDYDKAQSDEMNMLNEIDNMVKETLKNIENGTTKPKPEEPEPTDPISSGPMNPILTDTSLAGKNVNYTPKSGQVYNTEGKYSMEASGSDEYSGYGFQYFETNDLAEGWNIWGTSEESIYIISANITTKNLYLKGVRGYNNGVSLLDNICHKCYTDVATYPGSRGQNLKLEQLISVLSADTIANNIYSKEYGTAPHNMEFNYPWIWTRYEKNLEGATTNKSKAYDYTIEDATDKSSEKPYYTLISTHGSNPGLNNEQAWCSPAYYNMILKKIPENSYCWLSTRFVWPYGFSSVEFALEGLTSQSIGTRGLYTKRGIEILSGEDKQALRPIISFPRSMYELQEQIDGSYNIVAKR